MKTKSQEHQNPYAIIIGLDDIRGVYVARTLAKHEVPLIGIAKDPKHPGARTNVCEEILYTHTGTEELISTLQDLGPKLNQKAVLVPCLDRSVLLISRHRQELEEWYHIMLPDPDMVEMLMDKGAFYDYAEKEGFLVPRTVALSSRKDVEEAAKLLTFPLALKPTNSKSPRWLQHTNLKAFKAYDANELLTFYDQYSEWAESMVVQEWIEGPDANLYSINCYFDTKSEPVATLISKKLRQWPPQTGETCLGEECRDDVVLNESVRLFRSVGFRGLGYIEFKRDERSGEYFFVEPNIGRPTARSAIAEASGMDLLYSMYCDAVGWELPKDLEQKFLGVKWVFLRRDFMSALYYWRRGEVTFSEWRESLRGQKAYALFSWKDPAPFLVDLYRAVRLYLTPSERKRRGL